MLIAPWLLLGVGLCGLVGFVGAGITFFVAENVLNNNEIFVSTTYDSLINKDTVDNLYLDIKNIK